MWITFIIIKCDEYHKIKLAILAQFAIITTSARGNGFTLQMITIINKVKIMKIANNVSLKSGNIILDRSTLKTLGLDTKASKWDEVLTIDVFGVTLDRESGLLDGFTIFDGTVFAVISNSGSGVWSLA